MLTLRFESDIKSLIVMSKPLVSFIIIIRDVDINLFRVKSMRVLLDRGPSI